MTLHVSLIETPDILTVSLYNDHAGETHELPRSTDEHLTLVGYGTARITEGLKPPFEVAAPGIILFDARAQVTCQALTNTLLTYCVYNKNTAKDLATVRKFVDDLKKVIGAVVT